MLAGFGAFILAAILIFRRVDGARVQADAYGLARGLATGYYFNFIRPLVGALRDPNHPVHQRVASFGNHQIAGVVVGIPQSLDELDPTRQTEWLRNLSGGPGKAFKLVDLEIAVPDRPRPIFAKLALSNGNQTALIVDVPTTLAVIADFSEFLARHELDNSGADDGVIEARKDIVATSETSQFGFILSEFLDIINRAGSLEARKLSPSALLHLVPLPRMRRRMDELADH